MNYNSDVSNWQVEAVCTECGRVFLVDREQAWLDDDGTIWADDLCSEDDDRRAEN